MDLTLGELPLRYKVLEVLVVRLNCKGTICFQLRSLELQVGDYYEHFLVVDVVVNFCLVQLPRKEANQAPDSASFLYKRATQGKPAIVRLQERRKLRILVREHQSAIVLFSQDLERCSLFISLGERRFLAGKRG